MRRRDNASVGCMHARTATLREDSLTRTRSAQHTSIYSDLGPSRICQAKDRLILNAPKHLKAATSALASTKKQAEVVFLSPSGERPTLSDVG